MFERIKKKILNKEAVIGVIGLGYVGLPLVKLFTLHKYKTIGFDIDRRKISSLNNGRSYILSVSSRYIKTIIRNKLFHATSEFARLRDVDVIIICVPTPLTPDRRPDMRYVKNTAFTISKNLKKGHLIILESTTYPGTTREVVLPELLKSGLKCEKDFFLAYSPEREDPGNKRYWVGNIPKVVGGIDRNSRELVSCLYKQVVNKVVEVSSCEVAEATKMLENTYRCVNIALVNELKMLFTRMGIDIWEVIKASSTKPFGFQAFYPGPGWGGHCIPIDPFYLSWRAREFQFSTRFIELAGEINIQMPYYVISKLKEAIGKKNTSNLKILVFGLAYKKDIDDPRESPSFRIIQELLEMGASVWYNDPYVKKFPKMRHYDFEVPFVSLTPKNLSSFDAVILVTDHSLYDYKMIAKYARLIIDTRNAFASRGIVSDKIIKA